MEEAGPVQERRMSVRPAFDDGTPGFPHMYMNFAILDEVFGPSTQPNAHLSLCVTYYDNPELAGATFRPEVYQRDVGALTTFGFTPDDEVITLEGSDQWKEAYFEIPEIKFNGVNQGPQAAARFVLSDKIHFTRIRYGVLRPCGPFAGINPLEDCKPQEAPTLVLALDDTGTITLQWAGDSTSFTLESTTELLEAAWTPIDATPILSNGISSITLPPEAPSAYFRLRQ